MGWFRRRRSRLSPSPTVQQMYFPERRKAEAAAAAEHCSD